MGRKGYHTTGVPKKGSDHHRSVSSQQAPPSTPSTSPDPVPSQTPSFNPYHNSFGRIMPPTGLTTTPGVVGITSSFAIATAGSFSSSAPSAATNGAASSYASGGSASSCAMMAPPLVPKIRVQTPSDNESKQPSKKNA